jgi:hypothetical protein
MWFWQTFFSSLLLPGILAASEVGMHLTFSRPFFFICVMIGHDTVDKVYAFLTTYFKHAHDGHSKLSVVVVFVSLLSLALGQTNVKSMRLLRVLRALRLVARLRSLRYFPMLEKISIRLEDMLCNLLGALSHCIRIPVISDMQGLNSTEKSWMHSRVR